MAVAVPTEKDALVSQPARDATYAAYRSDLQLIKRPRRPIFGEGGIKVGEGEGITLQFAHGVYRIPLEGPVRTKYGAEVDARELNAWLRSHPLFGDMHEGFVLVEQSAPPVAQDEMERMLNAAMRLDTEALQEMVEQEQAGWARPGLLEPARKAIGQITEVLAAAKEGPAAPEQKEE